ncbi:MAG: efflux RND transporter periplasmic adaptor subunit, partial [Psychromonas sp.]
PIIDNTPLVIVQENNPQDLTLAVASYGIVDAKFTTELVAQVNGEIVFLSQKFVRGGFVKQGEVLARIDDSDYQAALLDAQANIASAQAALVLERALGNVAREQWSDISDSKPTPLSLRQPQLAQEEARLLSSQASLKRAERDVERTVIRAPYDALIESRHIGLGSYMSAGTQLGKIYSTDKAEIRLPVADHELQYLINNGVGAQVTVSAKLAGTSQQWTGKIIRSEGVIDELSRMNYLVAEIEDPYALSAVNNKKTDNDNLNAKLRYGTYVTAEIVGREVVNVTSIARHLVVENKVAVIDQNNKLHFQDVSVLRTVGSISLIDQGLTDGMLLITSALDYPIEGMTVKTNKALLDTVYEKQLVTNSDLEE